MSSDFTFEGKKILIPGGLGFIGSSLAHRLVDLGAEVTVLDVLLATNGGTPANITGIERKIELVFGDIRDRDLMRRHVAAKDFIFNLAGQVNYKDSLENPFQDLDISCAGHLTLLESSRHFNPQAKIIFASSRLAYGKPTSLPVSEQAPMEPTTIYGIHKLTAEKYHQLYWQNFGIRTAVLRITNPYGPRQNVKNGKYGIVNWFLQLALAGSTLRLYGDGSQKRDVLFIDDLVEMFLAAAASPRADGQIFNAGAGEGVSLRKIAELALKTAGRGNIEQVEWPSLDLQRETGDFIADISKMRNVLDVSPKIPLEQGLAITRKFYAPSKPAELLTNQTATGVTSP